MLGLVVLVACRLGRSENDAASILASLQVRPSDHVLHWKLGQLQFDKNDLKGAADSFTAVTKLRPEMSKAYLYLGHIKVMQKELTSAEQSFTSMLELVPNNIAAIHELGEVHVMQGKLDHARARLTQVIEMKPDHGRAQYILGKVHWKRGELHEAVPRYQAAAAITPDDTDIWNGFSKVYFKHGFFAEAEAFANKAIEVEPLNAYAFNSIGSVYLTKGELDLAEKKFQNALTIIDDPVQAGIHHNLDLIYSDANSGLGAVHLKRGEAKQANERLLAALKFDPQHANALYGLGGYMTLFGTQEEAVGNIEKALSLDPAKPSGPKPWQYASMYYDAGLVHQKMGKIMEAQAYYKTALQHDPQHVYSLQNLEAILDAGVEEANSIAGRITAAERLEF